MFSSKEPGCTGCWSQFSRGNFRQDCRQCQLACGIRSRRASPARLCRMNAFETLLGHRIALLLTSDCWRNSVGAMTWQHIATSVKIEKNICMVVLTRSTSIHFCKQFYSCAWFLFPSSMWLTWNPSRRSQCPGWGFVAGQRAPKEWWCDFFFCIPWSANKVEALLQGTQQNWVALSSHAR